MGRSRRWEVGGEFDLISQFRASRTLLPSDPHPFPSRPSRSEPVPSPRTHSGPLHVDPPQLERSARDATLNAETLYFLNQNILYELDLQRRGNN